MPVPRVDRRLAQAEKLHESTGVRNSLNLPVGKRLFPPRTAKAQKSKPNFDVKMADLGTDSETLDGESFPDGMVLLQQATSRGASSKSTKLESSETNYDDAEMDALLQTVDVDELEKTGYASLQGTQEDVQAQVYSPIPRTCGKDARSPRSPPSKRHAQHLDSEALSFRTSKRQKLEATLTLSSPDFSHTTLANKENDTPLYLDSDDYASQKPRSPKHARSLLQNSNNKTAVDSDHNVTHDDDECFVLDENLFTASPEMPAIGTSTTNLAPTHASRAGELDRPFVPTGLLGVHQNNLASATQEAPSVREQSPDPTDDYFADFEAWLNSGAVEIRD
jgi:ATP-dependent DNA helicase HFM1/MER3